MAVAAGAQGGIFGAAGAVVLSSDTGPVVDGVGEAGMTGMSSHDEAASSRSFCDGSDTCQTAQGEVISPLQGIGGFCKQRGEDDPPDSRQGSEDLRVTLFLLPRLGLFGGAQPSGQRIELMMGLGELPVD